MAKSGIEAQLNDLIEEIEILKKDKKEQSRRIKLLNEFLVSGLKDILNPEVFSLVKDQFSSKWGQFQRRETTDEILTEYIKAVQNSRNLHTEKIKELKKQLQKSDALRKEIEKQLQQVAAEADQQVDQLTSELNKSLTVQLELRKRHSITPVSEPNSTGLPSFSPKSLPTDFKQFSNKGVQTLFKNVSLETPEFKTPVVKKKPMSYEKVTKIVSRVVPLFSGERTPEISSKVYEFLNACQIGFNCLEDAQLENLYISCLSSRLTGDAFQLVKSNPPKTLSELELLIKTAYLEVVTLDSLMHQINQSHQFMNEDFQAYARRLLVLKTKAKEVIDGRYNATQSMALVTELNNSLVKVF